MNQKVEITVDSFAVVMVDEKIGARRIPEESLVVHYQTQLPLVIPVFELGYLHGELEHQGKKTPFVYTFSVIPVPSDVTNFIVAGGAASFLSAGQNASQADVKLTVEPVLKAAVIKEQ
jgi:hypothetical protein